MSNPTLGCPTRQALKQELASLRARPIPTGYQKFHCSTVAQAGWEIERSKPLATHPRHKGTYICPTPVYREALVNSLTQTEIVELLTLKFGAVCVSFLPVIHFIVPFEPRKLRALDRQRDEMAARHAAREEQIRLNHAAELAENEGVAWEENGLATPARRRRRGPAV